LLSSEQSEFDALVAEINQIAERVEAAKVASKLDIGNISIAVSERHYAYFKDLLQEVGNHRPHRLKEVLQHEMEVMQRAIEALDLEFGISKSKLNRTDS